MLLPQQPKKPPPPTFSPSSFTGAVLAGAGAAAAGAGLAAGVGAAVAAGAGVGLFLAGAAAATGGVGGCAAAVGALGVSFLAAGGVGTLGLDALEGTLLTGGAPAVAAELSPLEGSGPLSACCIQGWFFISDSLIRAAGSGTKVLLRRSRAAKKRENIRKMKPNNAC